MTRSSETSVHILTTRHYITEDSNILLSSESSDKPILL
jgi:hypothetical protein